MNGMVMWDERHGSSEVKSLLEKSQALIAHTKQGMKSFGVIRDKRPSLRTQTHGHGQGLTCKGCQSQNFDVFYTMQLLPQNSVQVISKEVVWSQAWGKAGGFWNVHGFPDTKLEELQNHRFFSLDVLPPGNAQDSFWIIHHRWWISSYIVWRWRWLFRKSWFHCCSTLLALCRHFFAFNLVAEFHLEFVMGK